MDTLVNASLNTLPHNPRLNNLSRNIGNDLITELDHVSENEIDLIQEGSESRKAIDLDRSEQVEFQNAFQKFEAKLQTEVARLTTEQTAPEQNQPVSKDDLKEFHWNSLISKHWPINTTLAQTLIDEAQLLRLIDKKWPEDVGKKAALDNPSLLGSVIDSFCKGDADRAKALIPLAKDLLGRLRSGSIDYKSRITELGIRFHNEVKADKSWIDEAKKLQMGDEQSLKALAAGWWTTQRTGAHAATFAGSITNVDISASNLAVSLAASTPKWFGQNFGGLMAAAATLFTPYLTSYVKIASETVQALTRREPVTAMNPSIGKAGTFHGVLTNMQDKVNAYQKARDTRQEKLESLHAAIKQPGQSLGKSIDALKKAESELAKARSEAEQSLDQYQMKTHGVTHAWSGGLWTTLSNVLAAGTSVGTGAIATATKGAGAVPIGVANLGLQIFLRLAAGAADDTRRMQYAAKSHVMFPDKILDEDGKVSEAKLRAVFKMPEDGKHDMICETLEFNMYRILEQVDELVSEHTSKSKSWSSSEALIADEETLTGKLDSLATEFARLELDFKNIKKGDILALDPDGLAAQWLKNLLRLCMDAINGQWNAPGKVDGYVTGWVAQTNLLSTPLLAVTGTVGFVSPGANALVNPQNIGGQVYSLEQVLSRARVPESRKAQIAFANAQKNKSQRPELSALLSTYTALGHDLSARKLQQSDRWYNHMYRTAKNSPKMIASVAVGSWNAMLAKRFKKQSVEPAVRDVSSTTRMNTVKAILDGCEPYLKDKSAPLIAKGEIQSFGSAMIGLASVLYGRDVLDHLGHNAENRKEYLTKHYTSFASRETRNSAALLKDGHPDLEAIDSFTDEVSGMDSGIVFLRNADDKQWVGFVRDYDDNRGWIELAQDVPVSPQQYLALNLEPGQKWEVLKVPAQIGMSVPTCSAADIACSLTSYTGYNVAPQDLTSMNARGLVGFLEKEVNAGRQDLSIHQLHDGFYDLLENSTQDRLLLVYPSNETVYVERTVEGKWRVSKGASQPVEFRHIKEFLEGEKRTIGLHGLSLITPGRTRDADMDDSYVIDGEYNKAIVKMLTYRNSLAAVQEGQDRHIEKLMQHFSTQWNTSVEKFNMEDIGNDFLERLAAEKQITAIVLESSFSMNKREVLAAKCDSGVWKVFNPEKPELRWQTVGTDGSLSEVVKQQMPNTLIFKCVFQRDDTAIMEQPLTSTTAGTSKRTSTLSILGTFKHVVGKSDKPDSLFSSATQGIINEYAKHWSALRSGTATPAQIARLEKLCAKKIEDIETARANASTKEQDRIDQFFHSGVTLRGKDENGRMHLMQQTGMRCGAQALSFVLGATVFTFEEILKFVPLIEILDTERDGLFLRPIEKAIKAAFGNTVELRSGHPPIDPENPAGPAPLVADMGQLQADAENASFMLLKYTRKVRNNEFEYEAYRRMQSGETDVIVNPYFPDEHSDFVQPEAIRSHVIGFRKVDGNWYLGDGKYPEAIECDPLQFLIKMNGASSDEPLRPHFLLDAEYLCDVASSESASAAAHEDENTGLISDKKKKTHQQGLSINSFKSAVESIRSSLSAAVKRDSNGRITPQVLDEQELDDVDESRSVLSEISESSYASQLSRVQAQATSDLVKIGAIRANANASTSLAMLEKYDVQLDKLIRKAEKARDKAAVKIASHDDANEDQQVSEELEKIFKKGGVNEGTSRAIAELVNQIGKRAPSQIQSELNSLNNEIDMSRRIIGYRRTALLEQEINRMPSELRGNFENRLKALGTSNTLPDSAAYRTLARDVCAAMDELGNTSRLKQLNMLESDISSIAEQETREEFLSDLNTLRELISSSSDDRSEEIAHLAERVRLILTDETNGGKSSE